MDNRRNDVPSSCFKNANRLRDDQLREGDVLKLPTSS